MVVYFVGTMQIISMKDSLIAPTVQPDSPVATPVHPYALSGEIYNPTFREVTPSAPVLVEEDPVQL